MLKAVDIYVLLGLLALQPDAQVPWTQAQFAQNLHIPQAAMTRSLQRLTAVSLLDHRHRSVNRAGAEGLLVYGVPYLIPVVFGPPSRGVPTAHSAPPLCDLVSANGAVVWADDEGTVTGTTLTPLHPSVPLAAREHPDLHALLALVDALRSGRLRERTLAMRELHTRIMATS